MSKPSPCEPMSLLLSWTRVSPIWILHWSLFELTDITASTEYSAIYPNHYGDVIMGTIAPQIISLTIVYSTVYSGADQRKHQSSASLAFVRGIHRGPVNSPHKGPVTRKMFPFDDVFMTVPASVPYRSNCDHYDMPYEIVSLFISPHIVIMEMRHSGHV